MSIASTESQQHQWSIVAWMRTILERQDIEPAIVERLIGIRDTALDRYGEPPVRFMADWLRSYAARHNEADREFRNYERIERARSAYRRYVLAPRPYGGQA